MSDDDTAFREASSVLKLFALGAHQVRIYVMYPFLAPSKIYDIVSTLPTTMERVRPSKSGARRGIPHQALWCLPQNVTTSACSARDPSLPHPSK